MNRYTQRVAELTNPDVHEINKRQIKPLTEAELQGIENELGQPLPVDYREFLRDYAGIQFGNNECFQAALYVLCGSQMGKVSIRFFYGGAELLKHRKDDQQYGYIPPELITIGENENARLFLTIEGPSKGSVYFWNPDVFPEALSYYPELELVARSFDDFIHGLKPLKENYYENKEYYEQEQQEIGSVVEKLLSLEPRAGNKYSQRMADLNGRFIYATLGEDAKILSEVDLQNIEHEIGYPLPSDYREFLRSFGGYSFIPARRHDGIYDCSVSFPAELSRDNPYLYHQLIPFFHGHIGNDFHDLLTHHRRLIDYLPSGLLPIAHAGCICIQLTGVEVGSVYRIMGNVEGYEPDGDYGGPSSPSDIIRIADSFDAFMALLQIRSM